MHLKSSALITAACYVGMHSVAFAHAHLLIATPSAGSIVTVSPPEIAIEYTEGLEPQFSSLAVTDGSGQPVALAEPVVDGKDSRMLRAGLIALLGSGSYNVHWHAYSKDGHTTDGQYVFTVAP